ncbi:MAG TPA: GntR family transcriptional regulator [Pirellulales bacterium]|nr:GntR family transcriptional regulator [Pirellulales bacterium]
MHIRIQRGSSVPISRQIDAQVRAQILSGVLRAEDQLPSVRQLARELAVNVNTVFRVYERLAADGLIELRHGDGTYVAPRRKGAAGAQLARRRREFGAELDALVRRALMLGVAAEELPRWLAESLERVQREIPPAETSPGDSPKRERAEQDTPSAGTRR